jgi:hypothetical protein
MSVPVAARVLVVGAACGVLVLAGTSWLAGRSAPSVPSAPSAPAPLDVAVRADTGGRAQSGPLAVLHDWDARRAAAWADSDPRALARLYTARSTAGAADVALLQRYADRGLRVRRMRMQVLDARVLVLRPRALTLEVVDRLSAATVETGGTSRRLPADQATTHRLELRLVGGRWRMDRVSVPSGPADP